MPSSTNGMDSAKTPPSYRINTENPISFLGRKSSVLNTREEYAGLEWRKSMEKNSTTRSLPETLLQDNKLSEDRNIQNTLNYMSTHKIFS